MVFPFWISADTATIYYLHDHDPKFVQSVSSLTLDNQPAREAATVAAVEALAPSNSGIALAIIIGLGAAAAAGALALGLYARRSRIVSYGSNYYCKKHKLPVMFRNGAFWCPRERKFLKR
jgi:hypothetical protein